MNSGTDVMSALRWDQYFHYKDRNIDPDYLILPRTEDYLISDTFLVQYRARPIFCICIGICSISIIDIVREAVKNFQRGGGLLKFCQLHSMTHTPPKVNVGSDPPKKAMLMQKKVKF